jgi:hypothetical protein
MKTAVKITYCIYTAVYSINTPTINRPKYYNMKPKRIISENLNQ